MQNFLVAAECAIEHDGKFLIIKRPLHGHAAGLLSFPGGKVEYSDGKENILEQAVKREVQEEVGINLIDPVRYVTSSYFTMPSSVNVLDVVFHTKIDKTILSITPSPREVPEWYWLLPEEIFQHSHTPIWLTKYVQMIINYEASIL